MAFNLPDFDSPNCQPFFLEGGEDAVLLTHGFTGSPGHMRPLGDALHAAGYTVQGLLLPGHGTTMLEMGQSDWHMWLDTVEKAALELKSRYRTVTLGGLSMGGVLSLRIAEMYELDALITFAPALRFYAWTNNLAVIAKYIIKVVPWQQTPRQRDPRYLKAYDIGYPGAPVAKVQDLMELNAITRPALSRIHCPTLVVQSRHDETVHAKVPGMVMSGISSTTKDVLWLNHSPHVCTLGADHPILFKRCIDFLDQNVRYAKHAAVAAL